MMFQPFVALLLAFFPTCEMASRRSSYLQEDLFRICPPSRNKKEVSLRTRPAIFTLTVPPGGLKGQDFLCHLELEAPSTSYGFHVFFEEMDLLGSEDSGCTDYVQFARDDLFVTTFQSPQFCGVRPRLNASDTLDVYRKYSGAARRLYVERQDSEMDFWVKLDGRSPRARNLTVTVTVFKKSCGAKDSYYARCKGTNYCVRKELFCDRHTNCAFPDGDMPTDEEGCDGFGYGAYGGLDPDDEGFAPANVPIIIIIVIVIVGVIAVFFIAMNTFYRRWKGGGEEERRREERALEVAPPLLNHSEGRRGGGPPSAPPDSADRTMAFPPAPPSYDEVIKDSRENVSRMPSCPPPYSESA